MIIIIPEIGINHMGSILLAKSMVKEAAHSGAQVVKFQSYNAKELCKRRNTPAFEEYLKEFELSELDHWELYNYCQSLNIEFMSTPFDMASVELLEKIGVKRYKIASSELHDLGFIQEVASKGKPMYISTGRQRGLDGIEEAYEVASDAGSPYVVMLHCVSQYPTSPENANLDRITKMQKRVPYVGYSDHTIGLQACITAIKMGCTIVEKHFSIDFLQEGPDIPGSMTPDELNYLNYLIRKEEIK